MSSRIVKQNQKLYINNTGIVGIQNFEASYEVPVEIVKSLGMDSVTYQNNNNIISQISINKLFIDNDPFIYLMDYDYTFNGHVQYKDKYFAFNSGVVSSYNLSCQIGQIPQLNVQIDALGDFGSGIAKASQNSLIQPQIDLTDYSNIDISLDDFSFNRLQNFSINISSEKNIIYKIGSSYPIDIKIIPPLVVDIEFSIKLNDYQVKNVRDAICKFKVDEFNIIFNKFKNPNEQLIRFCIKEAIFLGETYQASVDGSSLVNLRYQAFLYDNIGSFLCGPNIPRVPSPQPPLALYVYPPIILTTTTPTSTTTTPPPTTTSTTTSTTTPPPLPPPVSTTTTTTTSTTTTTTTRTTTPTSTTTIPPPTTTTTSTTTIPPPASTTTTTTTTSTTTPRTTTTTSTTSTTTTTTTTTPKCTKAKRIRLTIDG